MDGWWSVRGPPFVGAGRREGHAGQGDCGVRVHSVAAGDVVAGDVIALKEDVPLVLILKHFFLRSKT